MVSNSGLSLWEWSGQAAWMKLRRWRMGVSLATGIRPHAVLRDEALVAIVVAWPVRPDQLYGLPRVPRAVVREHGEAIIAVLGSVPAPNALIELPTLGIDTEEAKAQLVDDLVRMGRAAREHPDGLPKRR